MYEIQVEYVTGNSFGSRDEVDTVGCIWRDLDKAKLALSYIKAHHEAVAEKERSNGWNSSNVKFDIKKYEKEPWFFSEDRGAYWDSAVVLPLDDESSMRVCAFWEGYFEQLRGAKIICSTDTDMEFST